VAPRLTDAGHFHAVSGRRNDRITLAAPGRKTVNSPMRILALDSALARASAGVVVETTLRAERLATAGPGLAGGQAAQLPLLADQVLADAGLALSDIDLIAVTVGPGSFTGIRAALSLAHGLALGAGIPVVGVSVGEALADALPHRGGRALWVITDSRRGRVFLEREMDIAALDPADLPVPAVPVALAGDAAIQAAGWLAARGANIMLTDARIPTPRHIAMAALARQEGRLPPRPAQPLYIDPPETRLPPGGLRPPPAA
jgi:tRNA threonylcarbamoyladenosine biosynthesis protein TsaB